MSVLEAVVNDLASVLTSRRQAAQQAAVKQQRAYFLLAQAVVDDANYSRRVLRGETRRRGLRIRAAV